MNISWISLESEWVSSLDNGASTDANAANGGVGLGIKFGLKW